MDDSANLVTRRKPSYPICEGLRRYLKRYRRERDIPVTYERLRAFQDGVPLLDDDGNDTLWLSVIYDPIEMRSLNEDLTRIYAALKVDGDLSVTQHLYVDRIDFCTFGNSQPFRIRIVNAYNDNQDYYYIKRADASRIYGIELEHLLSPNRMSYFTHGNTLIEKHIIGIPGDVFIDRWLNSTELSPVRVAKELVKFNERCFMRLLGDMRSYNFVVRVTPDFEGVQVRIRAMDFDQQSYSGRKNFYLPQFFKENTQLALFCLQQLNPATAQQYQREEHTFLVRRMEIIPDRLQLLLSAMAAESLAPEDKVRHLAEALAEHYQETDFLQAQSMGEIVRTSLETIRRQLRD